MKLKIDENGNAVVQDGKPVYVDEAGKDVTVDVPVIMTKLAAANSESAERRKKIGEMEGEIRTLKESFDGLDAEEARKAIETVKNLDQKKLIDAGQVDLVKNEMAQTFKEKETTMRKQHEAEINDLQNKISQKDNLIYQQLVTNRFALSPFIKERTTLPPDIAANQFGHHFKVKGEGDNINNYRVVGHMNGEEILSRERYGELADFDEAISIIIDKYPGKDMILRGSDDGGSGGQGNAGVGGVKTIPASDHAAISANLDKIARGEVKVDMTR